MVDEFDLHVTHSALRILVVSVPTKQRRANGTENNNDDDDDNCSRFVNSRSNTDHDRRTPNIHLNELIHRTDV